MVTHELYANLSMNKRAGMRRDDDEHIYALFRTGSDETFTGMEWDADLVMKSIEDFESDIRQKPVGNVGRMSPYPRILPLRDLLRCISKQL